MRAGGAGVAALVSGPLIYALLQKLTPNIQFLVQVLISFTMVCAIMIALTLAATFSERKVLPVREDMVAGDSPLAMVLGGLVVAAVVAFFVVFW